MPYLDSACVFLPLPNNVMSMEIRGTSAPSPINAPNTLEKPKFPRLSEAARSTLPSAYILPRVFSDMNDSIPLMKSYNGIIQKRKF